MRYLGIDITFEDISQSMSQSVYKVHHAIKCIDLIQEQIVRHPTLRPVVLLLKMILLKHGLNQPYSGGLNSYSLVLMATAFLQHLGIKDSISKNLLEFLRFYG